jgi:ABC-type branched-subunit amino acid transport system substrate-binding protein
LAEVDVRNDMTKLAFIVFLTLLLVAVPLLAAACGDDDEQAGEKPKDIAIGLIIDLSGPSATAAAPSMTLLSTGFKYINEVEGGIDGAKLVLRWVDSQLSVTKAISGFNRMVAQDPKPVLLFGFMTAEVNALKSRCEEEKIPMLAAGHDKSTISPPGWAFVIMAGWADMFAAFIDHILEDWTAERGPKVAVITTDSSVGRGVMEGYPYAEAKGVDIHTEFISMLPVDATAQLLSTKRWGADFIFVHGVETHTSVVLKDAERLGILDEYQFGISQATDVYHLMDIVPELSEGVVAVRMHTEADRIDTPGGALSKEIWEYVTGSWEPDTDHGPMTFVFLVKEVLTRAIAEVGLENLDGEAVYRVLEDFQWDPLGTTGGLPYRWGPGKRVGTHAFSIYEIRGGKVVPLTDVFDAPHILEP